MNNDQVITILFSNETCNCLQFNVRNPIFEL